MCGSIDSIFNFINVAENVVTKYKEKRANRKGKAEHENSDRITHISHIGYLINEMYIEPIYQAAFILLDFLRLTFGCYSVPNSKVSLTIIFYRETATGKFMLRQGNGHYILRIIHKKID